MNFHPDDHCTRPRPDREPIAACWRRETIVAGRRYQPANRGLPVARPLALAIVAVLCAAVPGRAAIVQRDLDRVGVTPPPHAALPLDLPVQGEDGASKPLRSWLGTTPDVLVLADYTCKTLCGPMISITSDALRKSGLRPGKDFRLIVIGLDPKDTAADAVRMKQAQVGSAGELSAASYFLRGNAETIGTLTGALGFASVYDRDRDQFAHPAAAFVIAPDGRLARALPGLAIEPASIRLAIVDAGKGKVGTLTDHIRLLCYGYDPASGTYSLAIGRLLAASGGATIAALMLLIGLLLRREHAARRSETNARRLPVHARMPTTDRPRRKPAPPPTSG
jgi:protein SCO1/2